MLPEATDWGEDGLMVSLLSPLGVTVKVVGIGLGAGVMVKVMPWLVIPDSAAVILVVTDSEVSLDRAVAKPCEPEALLIVATEV